MRLQKGQKFSEPERHGRFRLQVFTAEFGGYTSVRKAAEEYVRQHSSFILESYDVFGDDQEILKRHAILAYPTVRLFDNGKLLEESTLAFWSFGTLETWIAQSFKKHGIPGKQ